MTPIEGLAFLHSPIIPDFRWRDSEKEYFTKGKLL